jgi:hypothetical protein
VKSAAGVLVAASLLHAAMGRAANELTTPANDRAGLYTRGAVGVGYATGSYRYDTLSSPAFPPVQPLHFDVTLHGPFVDGSFALGHSLTGGVALALEASAGILGFPNRHGPLGSTNIDGALITRVGLLADVYPERRGRSHVVGGVALARAGYWGGRNHDSAFNNVVYIEPALGPEFHLSPAFQLGDRFGLGIRFSYARLTSDHSTYEPLGVVLQASWTRF